MKITGVEWSDAEKRIIQVTANQYYMTTTEIAKKAKVSWNTANSFLEKLFALNWIEKFPKGKWVYWKMIVK